MSTNAFIEYLDAHESTAELATALFEVLSVRAGRAGTATTAEAAR